MAEERRYLLGRGEELRKEIDLGGRKQSDKKHPYTFDAAKVFVTTELRTLEGRFQELPDDAFPGGEAVAMVTLHPSYLAKSHFPVELLKAAKLQSIGTRGVTIRPRETTKRQRDKDLRTIEIYAAGTRAAFAKWEKSIGTWSAIDKSALQLRSVERLYAESSADRVRRHDDGGLASDESTNAKALLGEVGFYEAVLHLPSVGDSVTAAFGKFVRQFDGIASTDMLRRVGGLGFLPIRAAAEALDEIAQFSFLRGLRPMPVLRAMASKPPVGVFPVELPDVDALNKHLRVAIFDGGLPSAPDLSRWARAIDADGIGDPVLDGQRHGLAVTSSALFGPLKQDEALGQPFAQVDHVRVVDADDQNPDYYTVLSRIEKVLKDDEVYDFVNISMGPDVTLDDGLVHSWTTVLDDLLSHGRTLAFVAVGNKGLHQLKRVGSPGDAVNAVAVGACDTLSRQWGRAPYSSIGPGRTTGFVKPDILAFGGSDPSPFALLSMGAKLEAHGRTGTSYATPFALRAALSIGAEYGHHLESLAVKALLVHHAGRDKQHSSYDVGWGRIPTDFSELVTCSADAAHIVYQGRLEPRKTVRLPIPVPNAFGQGPVQITATICYACAIEPEHSESYTKAGLDVYFRPHDQIRSVPTKLHADTDTFFRSKDLHDGEAELRTDAMKWETVRKRTRRFNDPTSLHEPVFDIHYVAREGSHDAVKPKPIPYAMIITVRQHGMNTLYDEIASKYPVLQQLRPAIAIPIRNRQ